MLLNNLTMHTLIFTDLDGTLLDHHSYSFKEASVMLNFIRRHQIPLIIVTSKTKVEVIQIQKLLNINDPFIVENGAGIFIPNANGYETIALGFDYSTIRKAFTRYAKTIPMYGFFDMSVKEIAQHTGLKLQQAADAKERTFTEPFILDDESKLVQLTTMANNDGLDIVKGGRFYHLITKGQDKAAAIHKITAHYEKNFSRTYKTIALGDGENDLSMLQSVDTPVLIPHPNGSYVPFTTPNMIKAPTPGPSGWNSVLREYFHVQ